MSGSTTITEDEVKPIGERSLRLDAALGVLMMLVGCGMTEPPRIEPPVDVRRAAVTGPLTLIEDLPAWCEVQFGAAEFAELEKIGEEAEQYTLDEIRDALVDARALDYHRDYLNASKMYVLMRVLFVVPDSMSAQNAPTGMSYFLRPSTVDGDPNKYPVGWPVEWTNGAITAVAPCPGAKGRGVIYEAVDEFDAFRQLFPRRTF